MGRTPRSPDCGAPGRTKLLLILAKSKRPACAILSVWVVACTVRRPRQNAVAAAKSTQTANHAGRGRNEPVSNRAGGRCRSLLQFDRCCSRRIGAGGMHGPELHGRAAAMQRRELRRDRRQSRRAVHRAGLHAESRNRSRKARSCMEHSKPSALPSSRRCRLLGRTPINCLASAAASGRRRRSAA